MTIEQAKAIVEAYYNASQKQIEIFEKAFPSQKSSARSDKEAFEIAIEALEKQTPKKPIDKTLEYDGYYGLCSCCNKVISESKDFTRCWYCGQALDWSDTDD